MHSVVFSSEIQYYLVLCYEFRGQHKWRSEDTCDGVQRVLWAIFITFHLSSVNFSHLDRLQNHLANWNQTWLVCSVDSSLLSFFMRIPQKEQEAQRCFSMWSILTTHLDESWTNHFQLGLTKVFKFYILTLVGLNKTFRNVFLTYQINLLQVSL